MLYSSVYCTILTLVSASTISQSAVISCEVLSKARDHLRSLLESTETDTFHRATFKKATAGDVFFESAWRQRVKDEIEYLRSVLLDDYRFVQMFRSVIPFIEALETHPYPTASRGEMFVRLWTYLESPEGFLTKLVDSHFKLPQSTGRGGILYGSLFGKGPDDSRRISPTLMEMMAGTRVDEPTVNSNER